jgi:site-specific DNA recombinase
VQLDGYIRVSRVGGREGDSFISPDVQRERIAAKAASKGWTVNWLPDELDQSGGRLARPVFQSALERVERGESAGIIVAKLDRFARSMPDAVSSIKRLEDAGGILVSVADDLDTSTPVGRFGRSIMFALAELELERIRDGWDTARARAVGRGVHVSPHVPVGYLRADDKRLTPDPVAAPAVLEAFQRRADGAGLTEIGRGLADRGVRTSAGGAVWTPRAVAALLRRRTYLGEARSGEHVQADAHPAIISRALWEAAQAPQRANRGQQQAGHLLSGLLRCSGCRYCMVGSTGGRGQQTYRCNGGQHAMGTCQHRAGGTAALVDAYVVEQFLQRAASVTVEAAGATEGLDDALADLAAAEASLSAYRDDPAILDALGRDRFIEGLQVRVAAVEDATAAVAAAHVAPLPAGVPAGADIAAVWPDLSVQDRRDLLAASIDAVVLAPANRRAVPVSERCIVFWAGTAPTDLPRRGSQEALRAFSPAELAAA